MTQKRKNNKKEKSAEDSGATDALYNVYSLLLLGNLALVGLLFLPANTSFVIFIRAFFVIILFVAYYISTLLLLSRYVEKSIPVLKKIYDAHPTASKRISALAGMALLFLILNKFLALNSVLTIYGIAIATWLLSFLVPSKK